MLGCWASAGDLVGANACKESAKKLHECMSKPVSWLNFHLSAAFAHSALLALFTASRRQGSRLLHQLPPLPPVIPSPSLFVDTFRLGSFRVVSLSFQDVEPCIFPSCTRNQFITLLHPSTWPLLLSSAHSPPRPIADRPPRAPSRELPLRDAAGRTSLARWPRSCRDVEAGWKGKWRDDRIGE